MSGSLQRLRQRHGGQRRKNCGSPTQWERAKRRKRVMGRSETATVAVGIRVGLRSLLQQATEENYEDVARLLCNDSAFVEDENGCFNESFTNVIDRLYGHTLRTVEELRVIAGNLLETHGDVMYFRDGAPPLPTLENGSLMDRYLLLPVKTFVETCRCGYLREGSNGQAVPLDLEALVEISVYMQMNYAFLRDFETVLIVKQHAG